MTPTEFFKKIGKDDKDAFINLSHRKALDLIPTGSWVADALIGDGTMKDVPGGFPRGHITEIVGDESAGKSTLLMSGIREAQQMGGICVLLDFEQTFHPEYAQNLGVSLDKNKLILVQPMHFQQGARIIKDSLSLRPMIIGVDSVSAMTPREIFEGKVDEAARPGLQAQLMSAFLGYITKYLKAANVALVFTNQLRMVLNIGKPQYPGTGGPTEESSGGKALKFYSSLRIMMKKSTVERVERVSKITGKAEKEPVNVTVRFSIIKNKIDKPFRSAPAFIKFGEGFDNILSIIKLAVNINIIKRKGAYYSFEHAGETLINVLGEAALWKFLNENDKVFKLLQDSLVLKEDAAIKDQYNNSSEQESPVDEMDAMLENVGTDFVQRTEEKRQKKEAATEEE